MRHGLLVLAMACSGGGTDADGDGYATPEDCDDSSTAVHPDLQETCDGIDNDCDGQIDEPVAIGAVERYLDEDEDGYGVRRKDLDGDGTEDSSTVVTCAPLFRYAEVAGDCDDDDPSKYPGNGCP